MATTVTSVSSTTSPVSLIASSGARIHSGAGPVYIFGMLRTCCEPDCNRETIARGLCTLHYQRAKKAGLANKERTKRTCLVVGCDRRHYAKDLCNLHWNRKKETGDVGPVGTTVALRGEPSAWLRAHVGHTGSGCLTWPFARSKDGRPAAVVVDGKREDAARAMCRLAHGKPSFPKADAAHSCGNGHKACVHPQHLSWKTRRENIADAVMHGTAPIGERHYAARLTERDVKLIRVDPRDDKELARIFGCDRTNIQAIRSGRSWKCVT